MKLVLSTENKRLSVKLEDDACGKLFDSLVCEILHFEPATQGIGQAGQHDGVHEEITSVPPKVTNIAKPAGTSPTGYTPNRPEILQEGYTGFLYLRCPKCGKERGFCTRFPATESQCRDCGEKTPLKNLHKVHFTCECGKHFSYLTNITDPMFEIKCIDCGTPNPVFQNSKTGNYDDGKCRT